MLYMGIFAAASLALLYSFQDKILYMPGAPLRYINQNPKGYKSPSDRKIIYNDISFLAKGDYGGKPIKIHGWHMYHPSPTVNPNLTPTKKLVVFLHENAGNIGLRLDYFQLLYHQMDCDVLAIAYRGYSGNDGKPSEKGLKSDVEALIQYIQSSGLKEKHASAGVFLIGRSLGGAVAGHALHKLADKPYFFDGVVFENTFTSISSMVDHIFYFVSFFKWLILDIDWDTLSVVSEASVPMLFVSGDEDEIVPHQHTLDLYDASDNALLRELYVVEGGNHNDTWMLGGENYINALQTFMQKAKRATKDELRRLDLEEASIKKAEKHARKARARAEAEEEDENTVHDNAEF